MADQGGRGTRCPARGPLTKDLTAQALRTALDPGGAWIPAVLRAANTRLTEVRSGVPDAGGLVIANDQSHARAYAKILQQITGDPPTLVLSDEPGSSKRITEFAESEDRWMVAVRMVSEGVDVPRLAVGVYATATLTPLFFAQAVGRFVRARSRGETASVFLPSIAPLLSLAAGLETERDHALKPKTPEDEAALLAEAQQEKSEPDLVEGRSPLWPVRPISRRSSSTAASSGCRRCRAVMRNVTTSGCPGCWNRIR